MKWLFYCFVSLYKTTNGQGQTVKGNGMCLLLKKKEMVPWLARKDPDMLRQRLD